MHHIPDYYIATCLALYQTCCRQSYYSVLLTVGLCQQSFRFASYYGSSMVLQRSPSSAKVWGYAPLDAVGNQVIIKVAQQEAVGIVHRGMYHKLKAFS